MSSSPPSAVPRPSPLSIDLNLAPPPPLDTPTAVPTVSTVGCIGGAQQAYNLAYRFHGVLTRPLTGPAEFPGEAGLGPPFLLCTVCGLPESRITTIVCDACERGFHIGCARVRPPLPEDWMCGECVMSGRPRKRWALGAARLLDINAAPPSEGELVAEGSADGQSFVMNGRFRLNNSFPVGGYGEPFADYTLDRLQTSFDFGNNSQILDNVVKTTSKGRAFDSLLVAAQYIGMESDSANMDRGSLPIRRRKKDLTRSRNEASINQEKGSLKSLSLQEHSGVALSMENHSSDAQRSLQLSKTCAKESIGHGSQDLNDGLPVQYEDFFVISLGKIDLRMTYHGSNHIWPIGYKSIWHDRFTGSLFECQVADGGNSGPVFKVRRFPCSALPIPDATTVLIDINEEEQEHPLEGRECNSSVMSDSLFGDDIMMLLSDPVQPDLGFVSDFDNNDTSMSHKASDLVDIPEQDALTDKMDLDKTDALPHRSSKRDDIGEFYVEGRSSSSVWKMVSQTLIVACRESFKHSGSLEFHCNHQPLTLPSMADGLKGTCSHLSPLTRFSPSFGPLDGPRVIKNDTDLHSSCKSISGWLNKDRFGLDMAFVQEIIETLPESNYCTCYEFLCKRTNFSSLPSVASGRLLAMQKSGAKGELRVASHNVYKRQLKSGKDFAAEERVNEPQPPPGRKISNRLPAEQLGDVLQIWEFFCRFYEILGLKEPPSFEQFEDELIDPWPVGSESVEMMEKEMYDARSRSTTTNDGLTNQVSQTFGGSDVDGGAGSQFLFVPNITSQARADAATKLASRTCGRCTGVVLTKVHISLLKLLIGELLSKVAFFTDPNADAREAKPRRGRKKDISNSFPAKELKNDILCANELTWPELARRYVLVISFTNGCMDSPDLFNRDGMKLLRCLQGDGGVLCGSLSGVAGMEADAMLLAEAQKQITASKKQETELLLVDHKDLDAPSAPEPASENWKNLPDWAIPLEPIRKLPTNVGARIRRCVNEALDKNPPEWARKILEHSISKEVYKGNASGPTKKAALSVLAEASGGNQQKKPESRMKEKNLVSLSDAIMRKCRIILRRAVAADDAKDFCTLLGFTLANNNDDEDEGILGFPAMVSRPLDFRTVDLRLALGAYDGSHEAFLEDVREVLHNIRIAYGDRQDVMQSVETLSQNFEELYENEVLYLVQKVADYHGQEPPDPEKQKQLNDIILKADELPKAPWEDGVCKVCGIDKDDDSVLLCDTCDSEYHTYCLDPPLARIPEGNWYCPSCASGQPKRQNSLQHVRAVKRQNRKHLGEEACAFQEALNKLAVTMEEREYWEFSVEERIFLLKFLSDEVLNTAVFREHIEQCTERSSELQQKLRALVVELRNLRYKEETLVTAARGNVFQQIDNNNTNQVGDVPGNFSNGESSGLKSCQHEVGQNDFSKNVDLVCESTIDVVSKEPQATTVDNYALIKTSPPRHESDIMNSGEEKDQKEGLGCSASSPQSSFRSSEIQLVQSTADEPAERRTSKDAAMVENTLSMGNSEMLAVTNSSELIPASESVKLQSESINLPVCRDSRTKASAELPETCQENAAPENFDTFQGISTNKPGSNVLELGSIRNEIIHLRESISSLECQLMLASLRREFLGRDSLGRLYWVLGRPGKRPWLVADRSMPTLHERNISRTPWNSNNFNHLGSSGSISTRHINLVGSSSISASASALDTGISLPCTVYESDKEILELASWLGEIDPLERDLKECILQWQRVFSQHEDTVSSDPLFPLKSSMNQHFSSSSEYVSTKARSILEAKYGPFLEPDVSEIPKKRGKKAKVSSEERMYRCECLEPVWPSRCHCLSCHQTFPSVSEVDSHNDGKCASNNPGQDECKESDDSVKSKGARSESARVKEYFDEANTFDPLKSKVLDTGLNMLKPKKTLPYDFDEICRKFTVKSSNKELVQEIGLLGSNGIPCFVPSPASFLDSAVLLNQNNNYHFDGSIRVTSMDGCFQSKKTNINTSHTDTREEITEKSCSVGTSWGNGNIIGCMPGAKVSAVGVGAVEQRSSMIKEMHQIEVDHGFAVSESSLRPLVGKNAEALKRLKMNLLDMDAALPCEILKPSKSNFQNRCTWRAFVKCADSIFEMVQATILFEGMIKSEYLKNGWWYWSSQTAAAKTSTISSLALWIYTLDDSIIYFKDQAPGPETVVDSVKLTNRSGKKRKDVEVGC